MPETVLGLPLHPLVVHATVVLVPLAAVLMIATAFSARLRRWAGPLPLGLSALSVALTFASTMSGENLDEALPETPLIERHAELGEMLEWWAIAMLVVAVVQWLLARRHVRTGLATVVAVLGVVVAVGATVQVALVGHSGAKAVWDGVGVSSDD